MLNVLSSVLPKLTILFIATYMLDTLIWIWNGREHSYWSFKVSIEIKKNFGLQITVPLIKPISKRNGLVLVQLILKYRYVTQNNRIMVQRVLLVSCFHGDQLELNVNNIIAVWLFLTIQRLMHQHYYCIKHRRHILLNSLGEICRKAKLNI